MKVSNVTIKEKWWSEGLRFTCLGCGRCCRGEPGAIFFTPDEGTLVAEHLKMDVKEFMQRYVTGRWGRPSFVERPDGDCVFYAKTGNCCSIYALRPRQCRLFPFWHSVVESQNEWNSQAWHCPGMNEGRLYSAEEIQDFLNQSPFEDL